MPGGDPDLNVARNGDVMARGPRGWGPRSLVALIRGLLFPAAAIVDNAAIRADGTGGKIQGSPVIITDAGATSGVTSLAMGGALSGVTTIANSGIQTNSNATDATSISDGSSTHAGGVSVTKALWVGGLSNIAGVATFQNNIAQTGATTLSTGTGQASMNGNIVVASGKTITAVSGIIFANETLSTYDEGTGTSGYAGGGTAGTFTYVVQSQRYTRTGRSCDFSIEVLISAIGTPPVGDMKITGLPFASAAAGRCGVTIGYISNFAHTATYTEWGGYIENASSFIYLTEFKTSAAFAFSDAPTVLTTTSRILISGTYEV